MKNNNKIHFYSNKDYMEYGIRTKNILPDIIVGRFFKQRTKRTYVLFNLNNDKDYSFNRVNKKVMKYHLRELINEQYK